MKPFLFRFLCWLSSVSMVFAVTMNVTKESTTNVVTQPLSIPSGSSAVYFSAGLTATGSGTATNPYGCSGKDTGAVINGANISSNSSLILLSGTYTVSTPILAKSNWSISGQGWSTVLTPTATLSTTFNHAMIEILGQIATPINDVTISNMYFNGNGLVAMANAITGYGVGNNYIVRNCQFKNFPINAPDSWSVISIKIDGGWPSLTSTGHLITNNYFLDHVNNTTTLSGVAGDTLLASGNSPSAAVQYTSGIISNNYFSNTVIGNLVPLGFFGTNQTVISNNYVVGQYRWFAFDDSLANNDLSITGNYVNINTLSQAIYLNAISNKLLISGNNFDASAGIYVKNRTNASILNNIIKGTGSRFDVSTSTNSVIIGNSHNGYAFDIVTLSGVIVTGNTFTESNNVYASGPLTGAFFNANRFASGAKVPVLPDMISPVIGTSTFSSGVITATVSGLATGQKLSITQHADGTVANTGAGVSYAIGAGFATFTSSNALANNSFDWVVTSTP